MNCVTEMTLFRHPILAALVTSILRTSRHCDERYVTSPSLQLASFFLPGAANYPSTGLREIRDGLTLYETGQGRESNDFGATGDWTEINLLLGDVRIILYTSEGRKCE